MATPTNVTFPNIVAGTLRIDPNHSDTTQFGVYSTGTTKKHLLGTRYRVGDRVFRYARAGAALNPQFGAKNWGQYSGVTGGNVTARAIGDTTVDILLDATTGAAAWFGTANNMVGGFWCQPDGTCKQFRIIVGHERGDNADTIWLDLDGPITRTMIATSFMEIAQNPYYDLRGTNNDYSSVMGVPVTAVASGSYGWVQTWGPAWVAPNLPVSDTAKWRTTVFTGDGSLQSFEDATGETGHQVAGFTIDRTGNGSDNPPFTYLQISP